MNMEIQYTDTSHVLKILTILIKMMMVRLSKNNKRKKSTVPTIQNLQEKNLWKSIRWLKKQENLKNIFR